VSNALRNVCSGHAAVTELSLSSQYESSPADELIVVTEIK